MDDAWQLEPLARAECLDLLADVRFGRVGVTVDAIPAIFPINCSYTDGAVWFWTSEGTKLHAAVREAIVAFEVDEVDWTYHSGWSVLVVGRARHVTDSDLLAWARRLPVHPWAAGAHSELVRIEANLVSGRRIVAPG